MSVCYKKLQHMLIEREISHSQLMREAHISANIISKIKTGQYIALDKVESICNALNTVWQKPSKQNIIRRIRT